MFEESIINHKKYNNVFVFVINVQMLIALYQMQIKGPIHSYNHYNYEL